MSTDVFKVAIVGAGPAGFYAARALSKELPIPYQIDLLDRLPTPFGLVRGGVAPDHQNIKRISKSYARLLKDDSIRFIGNVRLGTDILRSDLELFYHAIVYATGNEAARSLKIPGEALDGVHSATEFVFWYNGHPDYQGCQFRLEDAQRVAVIGNGNVALDVARILAKKTEALAGTDITDQALKKLSKAPIKEIVILGRRGPAQSAFSPKELKELAQVDGINFIVSPKDIEQAHEKSNLRWLKNTESPIAQKNFDFLSEQANRPKGNANRNVHVRFHSSPIEFLGTDGKLTQLRIRKNRLVEKNERMSAEPTEEETCEPIDLVFKAIGYRGLPIPSVPFDEGSGTIPNDAGRVLDDSTGRYVQRNYVVGWAKRGPTGLLGTNRPDAEATVDLILEDISDLRRYRVAGDILLLLKKRGIRYVTKEDWLRIDQEEQRRGQQKGKIRDKFTSRDELLSFLEQ